MKAAARGDIQKVNMISQTDRFDIYEYTVYKGFNTNAMMQAIENNQAEVVKLLLNKDEEISERMDLNLEDAVRSGNYDIVNIFIEAGAFEYTEEKGASAVATACYQGNVEMAQFLIKSGAKDSFIREHGCIKWEEMLAKRGSECECKEGKTGQDGNCVEAGADE